MKIPEKGYYYHYKHTEDSINNYAYEVLGVAVHTEEKKHLVVYRPLYKNTFFEGEDFCARPLDMFMGDVLKDRKTFSRFVKITDPKTIEELGKIKEDMYKN